MRAVGIVCEYNPFHNGHLYHLESARKHPDGQFVVCVLSSNFLQRGKPSIVSKWARAKMAVKNGADLVIELPSFFSCQSAEFYAKSSVQLLHRLGIADTIFFGSEWGDINILQSIAKVLVREPKDFKLKLKDYLSQGLSFPVARSKALSDYLNNEDVEGVVKSSNNILAIEYIKAIINENTPLRPATVTRVGSGYLDEDIDNAYPSATAIRNHIFKNGLSSIKNYVPEHTYNILNDEFNINKGPVFIENLKQAVFYKLSSLTTEEIKDYPFVNEGLENRIKDGLNNADTMSSLIDYISSKRYPKTRISRLLMHILLDLKSNEFHKLMKKGPLYARLLYASKNGEKLFSVLYKNAQIPVFTSLKGFYDKCSKNQKQLLDFEIKASDIYSTSINQNTGSEFTHKFEIL